MSLRNAADAENQYVLTATPMKGPQGALDAARLLDQAGSPIRFVMCGEGPHKPMLQSLAAGLSNVEFLGLQASETFAELLKTADTHLIPQRAEAADLVLPSKLGGIFATGRPVIVMARPDTGLAAEVAGAGLVIPPGDAAALAGELLRLANDPELCHKLGQCARSIALTRWDKSAIIAGLAQTLEGLSERSKAADRPSPARLGPLRPTD